MPRGLAKDVQRVEQRLEARLYALQVEEQLAVLPPTHRELHQVCRALSAEAQEVHCCPMASKTKSHQAQVLGPETASNCR